AGSAPSSATHWWRSPCHTSRSAPGPLRAGPQRSDAARRATTRPDSVKSQSPVVRIAEEMENRTFEACRQDLPRGDHESPGCIKRERIVASKKVAPRAEPSSEGRRQHEQPNADRYGCSPRRGGSGGTVARKC